MRAVRLAALLLPAVVLSACSGFSIGVRQDTEDAEAAAAVLAAKRPGAPFPARELLDGGWTRLWVFRGGVSTRAIEDRIEIPFPESGEDTPRSERYLVFADEEAVVSSFTFRGPPGVDTRCLLAERRPLGPGSALELLEAPAAGGARLTPVAGAARCG